MDTVRFQKLHHFRLNSFESDARLAINRKAEGTYNIIAHRLPLDTPFTGPFVTLK